MSNIEYNTNHEHASGFGKGEFSARGGSTLHQGYTLFPPGDYNYNFEQLIDSHNPETIENEMVSVRWLLQAVIERSGVFQSNLSGNRCIPFIRTPLEGSLEQVEPIMMSRNLKGLHCDMTIFAKSFPLGSEIPIVLKVSPLAKVTCRRIQVWLMENLYFHGKAIQHFEPRKWFLLFEKKANSASFSAYPGSSMRVTTGAGVPWINQAATARGEKFIGHNRNNLLGDLSDDCRAEPTEMEFNVQLPDCQSIKGRDEMQKLHCDSTYGSFKITHKIVVSAN